MRIVFIGSVEFSRRALERLIEMNVDIVGVCTIKESKFNADHVDLSALSDEYKIPWLNAGDINSEESLSWIRDKMPDVIFCFGWSKLLGNDILGIAPMGVIGFHPAALPANRGRHPLIWALVLGLKKTAATFFFMDTNADSGDILSQCEIMIDSNDDARSLYDKVINVALRQIEIFVPQLSEGTYMRSKQDEKLVNSWRKRSIADGAIDWRMSADSINNLVRGLAKPYVGAHFIVNGQEIKVWKAEVIHEDKDNIEPGKVIMEKNSKPVVKCGENAICLLVTDPLVELTVGSYL